MTVVILIVNNHLNLQKMKIAKAWIYLQKAAYEVLKISCLLLIDKYIKILKNIVFKQLSGITAYIKDINKTVSCNIKNVLLIK